MSYKFTWFLFNNFPANATQMFLVHVHAKRNFWLIKFKACQIYKKMMIILIAYFYIYFYIHINSNDTESFQNSLFTINIL